MLAFTYHHSRSEGWRAVLHALMTAGFAITAAHPVKAEMSVAVPKLQAKEPIDFDIVLVCRKRACLAAPQRIGDRWSTVLPIVSGQVMRLRRRGRRLSRNDVRIIVMAQLIRQLSHMPTPEDALSCLESSEPEVEAAIERFHPATHDNTGEACP